MVLDGDAKQRLQILTFNIFGSRHQGSLKASLYILDEAFDELTKPFDSDFD